MGKRKAVAIVTPKIDTFSNPTLVGLIEELVARDYEIIFFGFEQIFIPKWAKEKLKHYGLPFNFYKFETGLNSVLKLGGQYLDLYKTLKVENNVKDVICVDPMGLVVAGRIKKLINIRIIYASFEIFFEDEFFVQRKKILKKLESDYSAKADLVVIQDSKREKLLRDVNNFSQSSKFMHIPVAPRLFKPDGDKIGFRKQFGIPSDKKIAVYSGSLQNWSGVKEIIELFPHKWNNDFWLMIHSHHKVEESSAVRQAIQSLSSADCQFTLHNEPFYEYKDYLDFLSCCDVGFATYFPNPLDIFAGRNIQEIGLSSGKFSTYMMLGMPAVTTRHSTYEELNAEYNFGSIIRTQDDIPDALQKISDDFENMRADCYRLYEEVLDPADKIKALVDYIDDDRR